MSVNIEPNILNFLISGSPGTPDVWRHPGSPSTEALLAAIRQLALPVFCRKDAPTNPFLSSEDRTADIPTNGNPWLWIIQNRESVNTSRRAGPRDQHFLSVWTRPVSCQG